MVDNPRFPHSMKVLRVKRNPDGTSFQDPNTGDEEKEIVFESKCGLRDLVRGVDVDIKVIKSDYKLSLPKTRFIARVMDTVLFTHSFTGETIIGDVEAYKTFNFGTNIWFQSNGNKHGK